MEREIKIDRRYALGNYKYMTTMDSFIKLGEPFCLDQNLVNTLNFLQILSMEVAYRKYLKLMLEHPHTVDDIEAGIIAVEELQEKELNKLRDITKELSLKINGKIKEDEPQI